MATYTLRGRVTEDGRLDVMLPPGITCGPATVTIELESPLDPQAPDAEDHPVGNGRRLLALLAEWEAEGWKGSGRTAEEIDEQIRAERDSWD